MSLKSLSPLLAATLLASTAPALAQEAPAAAPPEATTPMRAVFDVGTRTRDGVRLSTDVWLPKAEGRYPTILIRTPYLKAMPEAKFPDLARYFVAHGYAVAIQDVRGRGDSEGEFDFFFQEAKDGYDAIEGLAAEPWSNGNICMMGLSYWGTVQWLAAKEKPPHLKCLAPSSPGGRFFDELPYSGGAFGHRWALAWLGDTSGKVSQSPVLEGVDWPAVMAHRPLITADEAMGRKMRLYREFLEHDRLDDYWKRIRLTPQDFARIDLPVLTMTGLFDGDQTGALHYWDGMEAHGGGSKSDRYLIMGPWTHVQTFMGGPTKQGELELSADAVVDVKATHLAFFDRYLKGDGKKPDWPHARVYVTGANQWRDFAEYPPAADRKRLYLGDGDSLGWTLTKAGSRGYVFDPKNPTPMQREAADRRKVEERKDVLSYTSAALAEAQDVIGPVSFELWAASDARDTDFVVSLVDVFPDGRAVGLGPNTFGIIRARYRKSLEKPELLTPGAVERYTIDLGHVSHRFQAGHKIRIEVTSSAFPLFNPNQNTGNPIATDVEWKVANQTIFHGKARPSAVVLPVVKP